jgi:hypothetical protein
VTTNFAFRVTFCQNSFFDYLFGVETFLDARYTHSSSQNSPGPTENFSWSQNDFFLPSASVSPELT